MSNFSVGADHIDHVPRSAEGRLPNGRLPGHDAFLPHRRRNDALFHAILLSNGPFHGQGALSVSPDEDTLCHPRLHLVFSRYGCRLCQSPLQCLRGHDAHLQVGLLPFIFITLPISVPHPWARTNNFWRLQRRRPPRRIPVTGLSPLAIVASSSPQPRSWPAI